MVNVFLDYRIDEAGNIAVVINIFTVRLYASLQFALDTEEFKKFVEVTEKKMMEKEDTETEEDADDAE